MTAPRLSPEADARAQKLAREMGDRLRTERLAHGDGQRDVAERVGTPQTVGNVALFERGATTHVMLSTALRYLNVYGMTLMVDFGDEPVASERVRALHEHEEALRQLERSLAEDIRRLRSLSRREEALRREAETLDRRAASLTRREVALRIRIRELTPLSAHGGHARFSRAQRGKVLQ